MAQAGTLGCTCLGGATSPTPSSPSLPVHLPGPGSPNPERAGAPWAPWALQSGPLGALTPLPAPWAGRRSRGSAETWRVSSADVLIREQKSN